MTHDHTADAVHRIAPALADRAVPVDQLHPHPQNARRRDARARAVLRESLQHNGQYRTVIARRTVVDGTPVLQLLAGHGTAHEARDLGWTHVAADIHDGVDDTAAARIVAVDNRTSDLADYDRELLAELLALVPDLEGTGYSQADVDEIHAINAATNEHRRRTDPDWVPPVPATPTSCVGDVWILGPHRLAVGDGTDPAVVAAALDQHQADALITDPPYNVAYTGGTADALQITNDDLDAADFEAFLAALFTAAQTHTRPGGPAYVFHAETEGLAFRRAYLDAGWNLKQVLVWAKDHMVLGRQDHHWQHEPILYGWKPGAAHPWYGGRTLTTLLDDQTDPATLTRDQLVERLTRLLDEADVIRADRPTRNAEHPTMKPVDLIARLLTRSTRPGGRALDPCAGSGSLLIACDHTQRVAALVELDHAYADVICRRWQAHTGIVPVLEATGQPVSFVPEEAA